ERGDRAGQHQQHEPAAQEQQVVAAASQPDTEHDDAEQRRRRGDGDRAVPERGPHDDGFLHASSTSLLVLYSDPCRISTWSEANVVPDQWPCTTIGAQLRNRSGGLPSSTTSAVEPPSVTLNVVPPGALWMLPVTTVPPMRNGRVPSSLRCATA